MKAKFTLTGICRCMKNVITRTSCDAFILGHYIPCRTLKTSRLHRIPKPRQCAGQIYEKA